MTERHAGSRYLGSATAPETLPAGVLGRVPEHLPGRLSISLWDFSWYTRAGAGEPFEDLGRALDEARDRGYDAVRICAAPVLLFGGLVPAGTAEHLEIEGLGVSPGHGRYGQRTRWYDVGGGCRIDLRARFFELLDGLRHRGMVAILSSWEYQQSAAFAADPAWFEALDAVPLAGRYDVLARAAGAMLAEIEAAGYAGQIAFTELHNEVDFSMLPPVGPEAVAALEQVRSAHPGKIVTLSFGKPPHLDMAAIPAAVGLGQFHVYSYGVLDALQRRIDIRSSGTEGFPNAALRALLLPDAPTPAEYGRPADWKLRATVVTDQMIYGYDWVDARAWDRWLAEHYGEYRALMRREIVSRVTAVTSWARRAEVPVVIGEGWVGYTPLHSRFEDGDAGLELAELGVRNAIERGAWGVVLCSNAAPHHPMWQLADWQRRLSAEVHGAA